MQNKRLKKMVVAMQSDSELVGIMARDRLNLMREGETILRPEEAKKK